MIDLTSITLNPIPADISILSKRNLDLKNQLSTAIVVIVISGVTFLIYYVMMQQRIQKLSITPAIKK